MGCVPRAIDTFTSWAYTKAFTYHMDIDTVYCLNIAMSIIDLP